MSLASNIESAGLKAQGRMSKAFSSKQQAMTIDRENKTKEGYRRDALLTTSDRGNFLNGWEG